MDIGFDRTTERNTNFSNSKKGYGSQEATQKVRAFKEKFKSDNINGENLIDFQLPQTWNDANYVYKNRIKEPKNQPFYYGYYSSKWTKRFKQDDEQIQWVTKGTKTMSGNIVNPIEKDTPQAYQKMNFFEKRQENSDSRDDSSFQRRFDERITAIREADFGTNTNQFNNSNDERSWDRFNNENVDNENQMFTSNQNLNSQNNLSSKIFNAKNGRNVQLVSANTQQFKKADQKHNKYDFRNHSSNNSMDEAEDDLLDDYLNNRKTSEDSDNSQNRNLRLGNHKSRQSENFQDRERLGSSPSNKQRVLKGQQYNNIKENILNGSSAKKSNRTNSELQIRSQPKNINALNFDDQPLSSHRTGSQILVRNESNTSMIEKRIAHKDSEDTAYFQESLKNTSKLTKSQHNNNIEYNGRTSSSSNFLEKVSEQFQNMQKMSNQLSTSKMLVLVRTLSRPLERLSKLGSFRRIYTVGRFIKGIKKLKKVFKTDDQQNKKYTINIFRYINECYEKEQRGLRMVNLIIQKGIAIQRWWAFSMIVEYNKHIVQKRNAKLEFSLDFKRNIIQKQVFIEFKIVSKFTRIMEAWEKRETFRYQKKLWSTWVLDAQKSKIASQKFGNTISRLFTNQISFTKLHAFSHIKMIGSQYKMFGILQNKKLKLVYTDMKLSQKKLKLISFYIGNFSEVGTQGQSHCPDCHSRVDVFSTRNSVDPRPWNKSSVGGYPLPKFSKNDYLDTKPDDKISNMSSPSRAFVAFKFGNTERLTERLKTHEPEQDDQMSNIDIYNNKMRSSTVTDIKIVNKPRSTINEPINRIHTTGDDKKTKNKKNRNQVSFQNQTANNFYDRSTDKRKELNINGDNNHKEIALFSSNVLSADKTRMKPKVKIDPEPYFSANSYNENSEVQRELESIKNKLFKENNMRVDQTNESQTDELTGNQSLDKELMNLVPDQSSKHIVDQIKSGTQLGKSGQKGKFHNSDKVLKRENLKTTNSYSTYDEKIEPRDMLSDQDINFNYNNDQPDEQANYFSMPHCYDKNQEENIFKNNRSNSLEKNTYKERSVSNQIKSNSQNIIEKYTNRLNNEWQVIPEKTGESNQITPVKILTQQSNSDAKALITENISDVKTQNNIFVPANSSKTGLSNEKTNLSSRNNNLFKEYYRTYDKNKDQKDTTKVNIYGNSNVNLSAISNNDKNQVFQTSSITFNPVGPQNNTKNNLIKPFSSTLGKESQVENKQKNPTIEDKFNLYIVKKSPRSTPGKSKEIYRVFIKRAAINIENIIEQKKYNFLDETFKELKRPMYINRFTFQLHTKLHRCKYEAQTSVIEYSIAIIQRDQYFNKQQNFNQNSFGNSYNKNDYDQGYRNSTNTNNPIYRNTGSLRNRETKQIFTDNNEDKEFSRSLSRILQKSPFNRNTNSHLESLFFTEESRWTRLPQGNKGTIALTNSNWHKEIIIKQTALYKKRLSSGFSDILIASESTGRRRSNKLDFFQIECVNMGIYRLISLFNRLQARQTIHTFNLIKNSVNQQNSKFCYVNIQVQSYHIDQRVVYNK